MTTTTYAVPGMHCASCPKLIAMTLEDTAGVSAVDAQLEGTTVTVTYDETVLDDTAIRAAIHEAGYEAAPFPAEAGSRTA
jgi:copper chaperone CopZ